MDVLRIRNSTAEIAENEEAKKYWGVISEHGDKPGPDPWTCFGLALYDLVRATTNAPPRPMNPSGAKIYATPEMMVQFKAMLGLDHGFSRDEAAYLDVYTIDELLTLEFRVWHYETDMVTRDGGPKRGMPYITRDSFLTFLAYNAILHPEIVRPRLNALIENKDKAIHLVDPLTNQPFLHLIPASSLASVYRPTLLESKAAVEAANEPRIAKVMESRRAAAVAGGEVRKFAPGAGNFTTLDFYDLAREEASAQSAVNIQNQAVRNVAAISAANSELWGATQAAIAVSNGNAAQMAALF